MKTLFCLLLLAGIALGANAQSGTFPSPGAQIICSTTTTTLTSETSDDGVTISPSLRLNASCLDTDLALFSLNSPVQYRKPTFCYNNGYFPDSYNYPLAISRNSTANSGSCAGAESSILCDFTEGVNRPRGLSFIVCDVDNPYDTIRVSIYSGGTSIAYNYTFMESNTDSSYAWTINTGNTGSDVNFNGGANDVWGESSASSDWAKGAISFSVDSSITVDSVVLVHIIRNSRNDINAAVSIGDFQWIVDDPLPLKFISYNAKQEGSHVNVKWATTAEENSNGFYIQKSNDGVNWNEIGYVTAGNNFNTNHNQYNYIDTAIVSGQAYYYRIAREGYDSKRSYSGVMHVLVSAFSNNTFIIYPNPAQHDLTISGIVSGKKLMIVNYLGQTVREINIKASVTTINISDLPPGAYIIRSIGRDGTSQSNRFVKLK